MVLVLIIPLRSLFGLQNMITMQPIENTAKVMLASGLIVAYGYLMEIFIASYPVMTGIHAIHLMIVVGLFWQGILIVGTMNDYLTRAWLGIPGH